MEVQNKGKPTSDSHGLSAWVSLLCGDKWWGLCTLTMMRIFKQSQHQKETNAIPPASSRSCTTSHIVSNLSLFVFHKHSNFSFPAVLHCKITQQRWQRRLQNWAVLNITSNCLSPSSCWSTGTTVRHSFPGETELLCKTCGGPVKLISWIILVWLSSSAKALLALQRIDLSYYSRQFFPRCNSFPEKSMIRSKPTLDTQERIFLSFFVCWIYQLYTV